ncbi:unnamed protein product [Diatraea saccharalis]|uniref:Single domain-containing protein n=1 Tax=Diatraea saccharalis TaxID=40085 RepID=A0A9N9R2Y6_9NEOP|nr:unnamed protein product [Diatraea saccharalis]
MLLFKVNIILAMVGLSLCGTWSGFAPAIPKEFEGKEGCYVKEINNVVPYGSVVNPIGYCYRIVCGPMMNYAGCGAVLTNNGKCHKTKVDLSKPYPDCCPTIKCDGNNHV